jgi:arylformamidase
MEEGMALYRGMDRAALDAAYNNTAAVGQATRDRFASDWQARSEAVRAARPLHLDMRYGAAERARLDFFACGRAGAPTLAFLHGGYWQMNAKEGFAFVAEGPLAHGLNVATIGYTLAPEARMDAIVEEIRHAVRFLADRLPSLGGDPGRLVLAGWSAGGHLVAAAMDEPAVAAGLAVSGIYDLEPIRLSYLNEKLRLDEEEARRNSPLRHLPDRAGPLAITVGGGELPELRRQSADYEAAWRAKGLPGAFVELPGLHHYAALEELARPEGRLAALAGDLACGGPAGR